MIRFYFFSANSFLMNCINFCIYRYCHQRKKPTKTKASARQTELGYDQFGAGPNELNEIGGLNEFGEPNDPWLKQMNQANQMNALDAMNVRMDAAGNLGMLEANQPLDGDENSYKQFLEFEQQQQHQQFSKMLANQVATAPSLDEDYVRAGELEEEGSTDNEELSAINQCQIEANYSGSQMSQMNQHMGNGLGEVYTMIDTIPEETEDDLTSPDSVTAKKNLDTCSKFTATGRPADQILCQASGQAREQLIQQPIVTQSIGVYQTSGRIQDSIQPISQAQTVENLIKPNDSEAAKKFDLINSAAIGAKISDTIGQRQAGSLPASGVPPVVTSAADQWNSKSNPPTSTGAACFASAAVSQSVSHSVSSATNSLSEQRQPFSRGKKQNFKIKKNQTKLRAPKERDQFSRPSAAVIRRHHSRLECQDVYVECPIMLSSKC